MISSSGSGSAGSESLVLPVSHIESMLSVTEREMISSSGMDSSRSFKSDSQTLYRNRNYFIFRV